MLSGTGFVIVPTYDPATIGNLANHAAIESAINNVLAVYEAHISDPITVNIEFMGSTNPNDLAFSIADRTSVPYTQFLTALKAHKSSADDATAIASLPNTTTEPVQDGNKVGISSANEKVLGIIAARGTAIDGTITFNFSQMNLGRTTINPNKYDFISTAEHEIDEVLGLGSDMPDPGDTWIEDLWRYDGNGHRTYTTDANAQAYFSLDGHTKLIQFNQDSQGDYGDWASSAVSHVQDAFGDTGQAGIADPNIEYRALDVLGYHLGAAVNHAPTGTSTTVSTVINVPYVLKVTDFGFKDPNDSPSNTLLAVKFSDLPNAGTLKVNGVALSPNQFVSASLIQTGKLTFTPKAGLAGGPYFMGEFQVQDNGGTANGGKDLDPTAKVLDIRIVHPNRAPVGKSKTVEIAPGAYHLKTSDFGFSDPYDNPPNSFLAVKITLLPDAGRLTNNGVAVTVNQYVKVSDINSGKLVFTPNANLRGGPYFTFRFQVQDNGGTAGGGVDLDPNQKVLDVFIL